MKKAFGLGEKMELVSEDFFDRGYEYPLYLHHEYMNLYRTITQKYEQ